VNTAEPGTELNGYTMGSTLDPGTSQSVWTAGARASARLAAVFATGAACSLLNVRSPPECTALLARHVCSNPSLVLTLDELIRSTLAGMMASYMHYVPAFHQPASHGRDKGSGGGGGAVLALPHEGFLQLQLAACHMALSDYQAEPAVFLLLRRIELRVGPMRLDSQLLMHAYASNASAASGLSGLPAGFGATPADEAPSTGMCLALRPNSCHPALRLKSMESPR
jgi:hypothetical protein